MNDLPYGAAYAVLVGALLAIVLVPRLYGTKHRSGKLPPTAIKWFEDDIFSLLNGSLAGKMAKRFATFKDTPFRGRQFGQTVVNVHSPDMIRRVLAAEGELVQAEWPPSTQYLLGYEAVACVRKQAHTKLRKLLSTAFAASAVERYMPGTQALITEYCNCWAANNTFDVVEGARSLTFAIMVKIMLGFTEWFEDGTLENAAKDFDIWLAGLFMPKIYFPGTLYYNSCQARWRLNKVVDAALASRLKLRDSNGGISRPSNLLEVIVTGKDGGEKYLSPKSLQDNIINLLFAGHDTSASTLMYGLWLIATQHQDVWEKLHTEQREAVQKHGEAITPEVLKEMRYTNAVVQELLRFEPIIPLVPRKAIADFELGGYRIDKGNIVWVWTGKSTKVESCKGSTGPLDPEAFNPDRWLQDGAINNAAFMPFGGGVRTCLGFPLALMELKVTLAVLSRSWTLQAPSEVEWSRFPILRPAAGHLHISLIRRK